MSIRISSKTLVALALAGFLFSCKKSNELTFAEKRVLGTWQMEKVGFNANLFRNGSNKHANLEGHLFTFNEDFSASMSDAEGNPLQSGSWELTRDSNDLVVYLDGEGLLMNALQSTRKRLRACTTAKEGTYRYKLLKQ